MAKPAARIAAIQFCLGLGVLAVLGRAAHLQLVQGEMWAAKAEAQRTVREVRPARRGTLYDRTGVPLAITQEFFRVGIAPNEVAEPTAVARAASKALGVPLARLQRGLRGKKYLYYHGPFTATQVEPLRGLRGVHIEGSFLRFYPSRELARPIIGALDPDSARGASGLELALDTILTGVPGEAVVLKDHRGRRYDSPSRLVRDPVAGHEVVLTIDAELQEIAERALADAIDALDADGGDVVVLDPRTGELLALASRQRNGMRAGVFTDTYEPGSTFKIFAAASLLAHRKVGPDDRVDLEGGRWLMPVNSKGRTRRIEDSHPEDGVVTLAEAIQVSSNVGTVKFALRLTPEEQWATLRDFGFGSPTGVEFPSESRGLLAPPHRWVNAEYTRASLAMGYEVGVTPVQLAAAYGALANDGILLTPTLVREIRSASGELLYRHQPEPVRRAVSPEVAAQLLELLKGAAGEGGTGEKAQLRNYTLYGKTGTAVRNIAGRYVRGEYTASFAAIFPGERPEVVIVVKIDSPREGSYYGGQVAAPVTRTILEQGLASRRLVVPPRRGGPADAADSAGVGDTSAARLAERAAPAIPGGLGAAEANASATSARGVAPVVLSWPLPGTDSVAAADTAEVPDVVGQPVRQALHALHRRGFRVALDGKGLAAGVVGRTQPAAGDALPAGSTVTVWTKP